MLDVLLDRPDRERMNGLLVTGALLVALLLAVFLTGHAKQRRAWSGWDEPDVSGLTPFQLRCESALVELLAQHGVELTERCVEDYGGTPPYRNIRASLGDMDWTVWIDTNSVQLAGPNDGPLPGPDHGWLNLEPWLGCPEEVITRFVAHVEVILETRPE